MACCVDGYIMLITFKMAQEVTTVAEVFLGFGGKTLYTLGTACTAMAVIYGINRITGLGINIFANLPIWLGAKKCNKEDSNETLATKTQVFEELCTYGKICMLIMFGVLIKTGGNWLCLESTTKALNALLYK